MKKDRQRKAGFVKPLMTTVCIIGMATLSFQGLTQVVMAMETQKTETIFTRYSTGSKTTNTAPENALPFDADLHYVRAAVDSILPEFPMVSNVHDLRLTHMGGTPLVSFHCIIDGDLSLAAAHDVATDMERRLRTCAPKLDRILIHTDPSALIVMPEER